MTTTTSPRIHHDRLPRHDIKNNVYKKSRAPVHNILVVTCVHATPVVTAGGKREEAPEGDAVTALGAEPSQTQWMMTWSKDDESAILQMQSQIVRFTPVTTEEEC
jgi:hypothetical protein